MTNKEKVKLLKSRIKALKSNDWKFKDQCIFQVIDGIFYYAYLLIVPKLNRIDICIYHKPYEIDNIFWDIFDLPDNKKEPLSFRADAVFCIDGVIEYEWSVIIDNIDNPDQEILKILTTIDGKIKTLTKIKKNNAYYLSLLQNSPIIAKDFVITYLIADKKYDEALKMIWYCKKPIQPQNLVS